MGGCVCSISRVCTEEVCVRRSTSKGSREMKKVSCMSRAGWSGGKLRLSNTCQSSSISGPSAIVKPMPAKMRRISLRTTDRGWRVPSCSGDAVRVRSRSSHESSSLRRNASLRELIFSVAKVFNSLIFCPTSRFWSAGTERKSAISEDTRPFLLRYLMRSCSTASMSDAMAAFISSRRAIILSSIIISRLNRKFTNFF